MTTELQILSDHEIRNPLTSVLGFGELLESASPEEIPSYSETIIKETKKALQAVGKINEVLHLTSHLKSEIEQKICKINLKEMCTKVIEISSQEITESIPNTPDNF